MARGVSFVSGDAERGRSPSLHDVQFSGNLARGCRDGRIRDCLAVDCVCDTRPVLRLYRIVSRRSDQLCRDHADRDYPVRLAGNASALAIGDGGAYRVFERCLRVRIDRASEFTNSRVAWRKHRGSHDLCRDHWLVALLPDQPGKPRMVRISGLSDQCAVMVLCLRGMPVTGRADQCGFTLQTGRAYLRRPPRIPRTR